MPYTASMNIIKNTPRNAVIALVIQFLLGMYLNKFAFANGPDANGNWDFWTTTLPLWTHMGLAIPLVIGAIYYAVLVQAKKLRVLAPYAWTGLVSILIAAGSGELFVHTQQDIFSFTMAAGFGVAIIVYALAGQVKVGK